MARHLVSYAIAASAWVASLGCSEDRGEEATARAADTSVSSDLWGDSGQPPADVWEDTRSEGGLTDSVEAPFVDPMCDGRELDTTFCCSPATHCELGSVRGGELCHCSASPDGAVSLSIAGCGCSSMFRVCHAAECFDNLCDLPGQGCDAFSLDWFDLPGLSVACVEHANPGGTWGCERRLQVQPLEGTPSTSGPVACDNDCTQVPGFRCGTDDLCAFELTEGGTVTLEMPSNVAFASNGGICVGSVVWLRNSAPNAIGLAGGVTRAWFGYDYVPGTTEGLVDAIDLEPGELALVASCRETELYRTDAQLYQSYLALELADSIELQFEVVDRPSP